MVFLCLFYYLYNICVYTCCYVVTIPMHLLLFYNKCKQIVFVSIFDLFLFSPLPLFRCSVGFVNLNWRYHFCCLAIWEVEKSRKVFWTDQLFHAKHTKSPIGRLYNNIQPICALFHFMCASPHINCATWIPNSTLVFGASSTKKASFCVCVCVLCLTVYNIK